MTILTVRHVTTYRYRRPVALGDHRMMFRPRDSYDQRLIESRLVITPEPDRIHWIHDPFGNCVAIARFKARASELRFESTIRVDHSGSDRLAPARCATPPVAQQHLRPDAEVCGGQVSFRSLPSLVSLFDHLVGGYEERIGHREVECLGGFEVDDKSVHRWLLKWQIARFLAA
jgi:hypothetical protein